MRTLQVYSWRVGGGGPKDAFDLIADDLLKIKPGLSAHKAAPTEAGASLRPLLTFARTKIPAALVPETPVFLMVPSCAARAPSQGTHRALWLPRLLPPGCPPPGHLAHEGPACA